MKDEALKFIDEHTQYRFVDVLSLDGCRFETDKEYYVEPWVAKEAVEIALRKKKK